MLGLFPLEGTEKLNAVLPLFSTVTVCGLSLLVEPVCDGHNGPENPGEAAFDFRKAGGNRAVGRDHRARNQQSAGGCFQFDLPGAHLAH
jgi:hypothetical protein